MKLEITSVIAIMLLHGCKQQKTYTDYHVNGQIKTEGALLNDKKIGDWTYYDSSGKKTKVLKYVQDTLKFREFYNRGVLFSQEGMNSENIKHGITKVFYSSGQLKSQSNYVEGTKVGDFIAFYPDGQIKSKYIKTESGETTNLYQYYPNGQLMVFAQNMYNGEYNVYDSLGNRTIDLLMKNSVVVDTIKVY